MGKIQNIINKLKPSSVEDNMYGLLKRESEYEDFLDLLYGKIRRTKEETSITNDDIRSDICTAFKNEIEKFGLEIGEITAGVNYANVPDYSVPVKLNEEMLIITFNGTPSHFAIRLQGNVEDNQVSKELYNAGYTIAGRHWDALAQKNFIEFGRKLEDGITKENARSLEVGLSYIIYHCYPLNHGISEKQLEALAKKISTAETKYHMESLSFERTKKTVLAFTTMFKGDIKQEDIEKAENLIKAVEKCDWDKFGITEEIIKGANKKLSKAKERAKTNTVLSVDEAVTKNISNKDNALNIENENITR